jgi:hypothetical protein
MNADPRSEGLNSFCIDWIVVPQDNWFLNYTVCIRFFWWSLRSRQTGVVAASVEKCCECRVVPHITWQMLVFFFLTGTEKNRPTSYVLFAYMASMGAQSFSRITASTDRCLDGCQLRIKGKRSWGTSEEFL